jgi:hypothetical protein
MSGSSVLFRWLDINWTLTACLAFAGLMLKSVGVALFIGLFRHLKGKVQRMSEEETRDYINYGDITEPYFRGMPRCIR